ncbi:CsbD family protein [Rubripirellula reticaptiva]|uniref:CsbD-like domain-containing protein n=1 Tax=Rubripirellula reticaptiva TaxID=2528013 RepID=A0A5C6FA50_9BACT|nr:CsbD family protein [Rubripirellula reticaptiva]TWU58258.1 hypothetical protein Poly59_11690 [Rubripirellula reticaptiva]
MTKFDGVNVVICKLEDNAVLAFDVEVDSLVRSLRNCIRDEHFATRKDLKMVTKQELSGKWESIVGSVKKKYGQISDNELKQVEGDLNKLSGLIQQKAGQSREQVEAFLDECCGGSFLDQVNSMAENAGETLREGYEHVADAAREGYDYSVKTVSRRPLESLVAAAGVGMMLGVMIGVSIGARRERELSWRDRWSR